MTEAEEAFGKTYDEEEEEEEEARGREGGGDCLPLIWQLDK